MQHIINQPKPFSRLRTVPAKPEPEIRSSNHDVNDDFWTNRSRYLTKEEKAIPGFDEESE